MDSEYENLAGVVLTAAESLRGPFTVEELASTLGVSKVKKLEEIKLVLKDLCMIGMMTQKGDRWLLTSFEQRSTPMEQISASATTMCSTQAHPITEPVSYSSKSQAMCSNTSQITKRSSDLSSYDCDSDALQDNKYKLERIVEVLQSAPSPLKGRDVAVKTGLGQSKGDVNRYLYFLEKKGALVRMGNTWKFERIVEASDFFVYAAELAKQAPSKKQNSRSGQSTTCEYGCVNSTGNCIHIKQENHYHQYNVQVGDGSRLEIHSHVDGQHRRDEQSQNDHQ